MDNSYLLLVVWLTTLSLDYLASKDDEKWTGKDADGNGTYRTITFAWQTKEKYEERPGRDLNPWVVEYEA
jgi:hypothetical protein